MGTLSALLKSSGVSSVAKLPFQYINTANPALSLLALNTIQVVQYSSGTCAPSLPTAPSDGDVIGFMIRNGRTDTQITVTNGIPIVAGGTTINDYLIVDKTAQSVMLKYSQTLNAWELI